MGGALTLIVNNKEHQNPENIIMIDDGTGLNVAIPTIMIGKEDGDQLIAAIKRTEESNKDPSRKKEFVVLLVDFEIVYSQKQFCKQANPDDRVEYDIWYTSGDPKALEFIRQMRRYNQRLGKHALMTPHMMVWVCRYCKEPGNNCKRVGDVIYCPPPTSNSKLSGSTIIDMGLEELCIYDIYKNQDNAEKWWKYMDALHECKSNNFASGCVDSAKGKAGIDKAKLAGCINRAGEILLHEYAMWQSSGVPYNPAVVVNNHVYRVQFWCQPTILIGFARRGQCIQDYMCWIQCNSGCMLPRL
eukprot:TRINITY_DN105834_c0_g1_i1.p1 TRINITY_DN105834_c0_g1~~TRINITY_DN105834_c0_g1_i1.p1  ORF type:complete len:300 (+),score=28.82 TRINITY_DN105834_c0_g1_i1:503-1402(+)